MANTARDLIKCSISNAPGTTGGFTLAAAAANSLMPGAGDDGLKFKLNITQNGVGTELRKDCTYTHSSTSFSRGTMVRSTGAADAALNFTDAAIVSVVPSAEDYLTTEEATAVKTLWTDGTLERAIAGNASVVQPYVGDYAAGVAVITLNRNVTIVFPTELESGKVRRYRLTLQQDSFGGWVPTFPAIIYWEGGSEPQPPLVANDWATYEFITGDGGYTWKGARLTAVTAAKVFDRFYRANNASALGTAPIGGAWTAHTGTWGIDNYSAYVATRSGDTVASVDAGSATQTVHCDCIPGDPNAILAVTARVADENNCLIALLRNPTSDPHAVSLYKRVSGTYTDIASGWVSITQGLIVHSEPTRVSIACSGNLIKVYVNGVEYISVTESDLNTNTRAGIRLNDDTTGNRWCNLVVV